MGIATHHARQHVSCAPDTDCNSKFATGACDNRCLPRARGSTMFPLWRRRTYRLSQNVRPLVWVECTVEKHSRSRTEYLVKARSQFKERSSASNVEIFLPLPPDAITPTVRASQVRTCRCSGVSGERETLERHWKKPVPLGGMPVLGRARMSLIFTASLGGMHLQETPASARLSQYSSGPRKASGVPSGQVPVLCPCPCRNNLLCKPAFLSLHTLCIILCQTGGYHACGASALAPPSSCFVPWPFLTGACRRTDRLGQVLREERTAAW